MLLIYFCTFTGTFQNVIYFCIFTGTFQMLFIFVFSQVRFEERQHHDIRVEPAEDPQEVGRVPGVLHDHEQPHRKAQERRVPKTRSHQAEPGSGARQR